MEAETSARLDIEIKEKESQLTSLKAEIVARQRLIAGLNDKVDAKAWQDKARRLEDEVVVRDKQIAVLNDRLIVLDSQIRERHEVASQAGKIKSLENELNAAKLARDEAEEMLKTSRSELEEAIGRCNEAVASLEDQNMKLQAKLRSQQQTSETHLSDLRTHYEEAIAKANLQILDGKSKAELLASQLKSQSQLLSENETEIQDITNKNTNLTEKLNSLNLKLERLEKLNSQLEHVNSQASHLKLSLSSEVEKHQELLKAFKALQGELKLARDENTQLEECVKEQQEVIEQAEFKIRREAGRCRELEEALSKLEHNYKGELVAISSRLHLTAAELEQVRSLLQLKKVEATETLQLKNELRLMREQISELMGQKRNLTDRVETIVKERENLTTEIRTLNRRYEGLKADYASKLETLENTLKEQENQHRKAKRGLMNEVEQLKGELEDKGMKLIHAQSQIDELKKKLTDTQCKVKSLVAEQLSQSNQQLEDKDQQIKLLKEMLRSSQTQVRQRDDEVGRLKKKVVEVKR
mmetsp:Transcript_13773/g.25981  ORF Transcript_13773/g.25981 Transcript_13773/m.25981 type:complete len:527 (+) Transcript_13773:117-1697(+)|eukprot:CAMPEP_0204911644 /NCGR_PEP_ID=MMETSP1397-20131031/9944_1 /ASSEMBLY_ACC=CAM_ASM_000891 /TAXON_ID=49980 /ORGANISM="Climacostomum Climacostomum virens, Strain Stock W-24" /LENGTH=526 /DNA_ID=CAMNT_0052082267 /DNA_START=43 /DNA_END=1623 /DNA_ORIENTATION=-